MTRSDNSRNISLEEMDKQRENLPEIQEEKKSPQAYNKGRQKSESEIIQKALEVFGGVVIR